MAVPGILFQRSLILILISHSVTSSLARSVIMSGQTVEADQHIVGIMRHIKPQIERNERTTFTVFGPLAYQGQYQVYTGDLTYWVKVVYDEGFMHVKVQTPQNLIPQLLEYRKGRTFEEMLPGFNEELSPMFRKKMNTLVLSPPLT